MSRRHCLFNPIVFFRSQRSIRSNRRDINTSPLPLLTIDRSAGPPKRPTLVEISAETSIREDLPIATPKSMASKGSVTRQASMEDHSFQTSLTDSVKSRRENGQQTSIAEMLDGEMQTGDRSGEDSCDDRMLSDGEMSRSAMDFLHRPSPFK